MTKGISRGYVYNGYLNRNTYGMGRLNSLNHPKAGEVGVLFDMERGDYDKKYEGTIFNDGNHYEDLAIYGENWKVLGYRHSERMHCLYSGGNVNPARKGAKSYGLEPVWMVNNPNMTNGRCLVKQSELEEYAAIPQPPRDQMGFLADLKQPLKDFYAPGLGCEAGSNDRCLERGFRLITRIQQPQWRVDTALNSLQRVLHDKEIREAENGYPILLQEQEGFAHEEYEVISNQNEAILRFGDSEGLRRAVYFYEDRLRECEGPAATPGSWRRHPYVRHRISRCFFGPTYRAPFFIDELMNDVDYYPDAYLDKLAHEGINGLWLSMYFKDLPSSIFPGRGADAPRRLEKLRKTVERCARFGIKIYLFFSEPKIWGEGSDRIPMKDAQTCPEAVGPEVSCGLHAFCTSSECGRRYLQESVTQIFSAVPQLGGLINIMFGEDNGACSQFELDYPDSCQCPRCRELGPVRVLHEQARLMTEAMKKVAPQAEYIGWFYAPRQRDDTARSRRLASVAEGWPEDSGLMFNFESGGQVEQLGMARTVFDYSLAYVGPSKLFAEVAGRVKKMAAKLQVGCSHEDASVPFIPVPLNLYDKYRTLHDYHVYAVMQCWYFGNYPGLMNKAAGKLSFEPFADSGDDFLRQLARPDWKRFAPQVVEAWRLFSKSYRQFPGNIAFEWYGPLHNSLAWPWHLFPVDQPLTPTWLLKNFPEVSGDRVGECLGYHHTMTEALQLLQGMCEDWQAGLEKMLPLRQVFAHDPNRLADINLAEAIGLQMNSTRNMLQFYVLREKMFYEHSDQLKEMAELVKQEIKLTERMNQLCLVDRRLGYHSEAEGYLFFPEKLTARKRLLEQLLNQDFPRFSLTADWIDQFTGKRPTGPVARMAREEEKAELYECGETGVKWSSFCDQNYVYFQVFNGQGKKILFEVEPCRCQPVLYFHISEQGQLEWDNFYQRCEEKPSFKIEAEVMTVGIPRHILARYHKPGFPMRVNVSADGYGWIKREPWPYRLYQQDTNPACLGWLISGR